MKGIAVFFPGIGYTADKPLMHYSRRIAAGLGYENRVLVFSGFPEKVWGDREKMVRSYEIALEQSRHMLEDLDFSLYDRVLFVGKSIGTIAAAQTAAESGVPVRLLHYTPLEDTFRFPFGDALVFTGDGDPWVGKEKSRIPALCAERKIPCIVIPGANHSLEGEDIGKDLENMRLIMEKTRDFMARG